MNMEIPLKKKGRVGIVLPASRVRVKQIVARENRLNQWGKDRTMVDEIYPNRTIGRPRTMHEPITPSEYHEANRLSWNEATVAQNSHKKDQAGFLRRGGSTLFPEEVELLGDLTGKRLVHLQCNAGQD